MSGDEAPRDARRGAAAELTGVELTGVEMGRLVRPPPPGRAVR